MGVKFNAFEFISLKKVIERPSNLTQNPNNLQRRNVENAYRSSVVNEGD